MAHSEGQRGGDFKTVTLPRNLILACLYMLHVQDVYPKKQPNSLQDPSVVISRNRWLTITKFGCWVPCACSCGGEWNFGGEHGIRRGSQSQQCKVLSFTQKKTWLRRDGRDCEEGAILEKNQVEFFKIPTRGPTPAPLERVD